MNRPWKAADIPDALMVRVIGHVQREKQKEYGFGKDHLPWALWWDLEKRLPVPWKVIMAKGRRLNKRGLLDGCFCGCRGDLELTEAGWALYKETLKP